MRDASPPLVLAFGVESVRMFVFYRTENGLTSKTILTCQPVNLFTRQPII